MDNDNEAIDVDDADVKEALDYVVNQVVDAQEDFKMDILDDDNIEDNPMIGAFDAYMNKQCDECDDEQTDSEDGESSSTNSESYHGDYSDDDISPPGSEGDDEEKLLQLSDYNNDDRTPIGTGHDETMSGPDPHYFNSPELNLMPSTDELNGSSDDKNDDDDDEDDDDIRSWNQRTLTSSTIDPSSPIPMKRLNTLTQIFTNEDEKSALQSLQSPDPTGSHLWKNRSIRHRTAVYEEFFSFFLTFFPCFFYLLCSVCFCFSFSIYF